MNLCTVTSQLISGLSSLTTKHMVFSLLWPWTWNEYAYPGTDLWVTQNEFHTSLIPDLLFTSWPNIWVGLVDAQLDQNDCLGIRCFSWSKSKPVIAYPLLLWRCLSQTSCYGVKKKKVHNETLMRTHFRQSRGHNFGKHEANQCLLNTPTAGAVLNFTYLCCHAHSNVWSCSRYACNLCIYLCKRTSHLCVKWEMWM